MKRYQPSQQPWELMFEHAEGDYILYSEAQAHIEELEKQLSLAESYIYGLRPLGQYMAKAEQLRGKK